MDQRPGWRGAGERRQNKTFYSAILGRTVALRATTHALRWIDKVGGFDRYILHTPDRKLASAVASALKLEMQRTLAEQRIHAARAALAAQAPAAAAAPPTSTAAAPSSS
jgi:ribosomal protein L28